jgi:hypothetical protein
MTRLLIAPLLLLTIACRTAPPAMTDPATLDALAERYVRLVLAMGLHDADYVDAYYGPPAWKESVQAEHPTVEQIRAAALELLEQIPGEPAAAASRPGGDDATLLALRRHYLRRQLEALVARAEMLGGKRFTFDEQAVALYDARPPVQTEASFEAILRELDAKIPGDGPLIERLDRFRSGFAIPGDRLDAVFRAAIDGCRARTRPHIALPAGETFRLEYVTGKSWSGYNWYQGSYQSLIQVNTELPIYIDRAIDLACHEGYPGHHVYNAMLEKTLVRDRGWVEYSVYALFSPQSLIAEGTANFGIEVAFPAARRLEFEKSVLFPLAGLDPARADAYYAVLALIDRLGYAGNEAARRYIDGTISAEEAAAWLTKYALYSPDRARQRVRFIDQYGAYVINYNLGKDLVRRHVESLGGTETEPERRWRVFVELLSSPRLPSTLSR